MPFISFDLGVLVVCETDIKIFFSERSFTRVVLPAPEGEKELLSLPFFLRTFKFSYFYSQ